MKIDFSLKLAPFCIVFLLLLSVACNKSPKIINPQEETHENTGIFSDDMKSPETIDSFGQNNTEDLHTVTILEALPTVKYVYLRVKEGDEEFWIATLKMEVTIGEIYFYRGGLLKTNFESREHQRVFDRMYLVSSLVKADHGKQTKSIQPSTENINNKDAEIKGVVKIADLVANPKQYDGKKISIRGKCIKINSNIMGRNWVHIQDGSQDNYDLVITCNVQIPVGHTITMSGKVILDKDFGSGYKYSILLEEGELVQ